MENHHNLSIESEKTMVVFDDSEKIASDHIIAIDRHDIGSYLSGFNGYMFCLSEWLPDIQKVIDDGKIDHILDKGDGTYFFGLKWDPTKRLPEVGWSLEFKSYHPWTMETSFPWDHEID
jgi:hypothetical protein